MKVKNAIVGVKVQIKRSSKWYREQSVCNPKDTTGAITSFDLDAATDGILVSEWTGVTGTLIVTV